MKELCTSKNWPSERDTESKNKMSQRGFIYVKKKNEEASAGLWIHLPPSYSLQHFTSK